MSGQIKLCQRWKENKADPVFRDAGELPGGGKVLRRENEFLALSDFQILDVLVRESGKYLGIGYMNDVPLFFERCQSPGRAPINVRYPENRPTPLAPTCDSGLSLTCFVFRFLKRTRLRSMRRTLSFN
jgi:hypothetical protein